MTRIKLKIRKGDRVTVITGKDKGKKGNVIKVLKSEMKVLVEGLNMVKKHIKPNQKMPQGGIISKEMPLHYSNVQLLDPKTDQGARVGFKFLTDGKKVRFSRRSGEVIGNV